ncbi:MAG: hypothetical protein ACRD0J_03705, partial [Acidimicrobiales bacterium]
MTATDEIELVRALCPDVPTLSPRARASAQAALDQVIHEEARQNTGPQGVPTPESRRPPRQWARRRWVALGGAAAAVAAVVVLVVGVALPS